jgi:hypothetical protein
MSPTSTTQPARRDLFALSRASVDVLVADLETEATLDDPGDATPPRAEQVAGLVLAEAIRLIRLGTRAEIARASNSLAQLLIADSGERLEREQEETYRLLVSASTALSAATPASSKGGALTVLRSWKGKACELVEMLNETPERPIQRAYLRTKLGIEDESHFSHLLSDLEAARLIVRVRTGREVAVRLGTAAHTDEVRKALQIEGEPILRRRKPDRYSQLESTVVANFPDYAPPTHDFLFEVKLPAPSENELLTYRPTTKIVSVDPAFYFEEGVRSMIGAHLPQPQMAARSAS